MSEHIRPQKRQPGQILLMAALLMVVLLVLAGSAYDYASLVSEREQLQNAVDSAALAGANTLSRNSMDPVPTAVWKAEATSTEYLRRNGFQATPGTTVTYRFPTSTPVGSNPPSEVREHIELDVTRDHQTYFWQLVGLGTIPLPASASAATSRGMVDVMLSLDTTGSMTLSGTNDFQNLRQAVVDFIDVLNPNVADPRGPKIGMARFSGRKCSWTRGNSDGTSPVGNGDTNIDFVAPSEWTTPCTDDYDVLAKLTNDKEKLTRIAIGGGTGTCPVDPPTDPSIACPVNHIPYTNPPVLAGTPVVPTNQSSIQYTGTRLPNSITVVSRAGFNAWATEHGGRNDSPAGTGTAKKFLVIMTDGFNQVSPSGGSPENAGGWDAEFVAAANSLKASGVEIYTVGFFCVIGSTPPPSAGAEQWCSSGMFTSSSPLPHPCPGPLPDPSKISTIDQVLINASSSTPGTCDHYYPLRKTDKLSDVFKAIAGQISRGKLTG